MSRFAQARYEAAVELEQALDQRRLAVQYGRAATVHQRRVTAAETRWDRLQTAVAAQTGPTVEPAPPSAEPVAAELAPPSIEQIAAVEALWNRLQAAGGAR